MKMINDDVWTESPITGKEHVLVEYDDKHGESKFDISSGYFTNEYPMNYKKYPDFNHEEMEESMPEIVKNLKFDDGESYWYPCTIQSENGVVFPEGTADDWKWCFAPIVPITPEQAKEMGVDEETFNQKIDMDSAIRYDRFLDAVKNINGYSLGDIELDGESDK